MSRVLVTGATGFVGRALCPVLLAAGHAVSGTTRLLSANLDGVALHAVGDMGAGTDWGPLLDGIDTVVHLAARVHVVKESADDPLALYRLVNVDTTRRLADAAAAAGVRRLVYLSTVKVHGETSSGRPFTEEDDPAPADPYGQSKWEAEQAVAAAGGRIETVVLRPPLVYGPHVRGNFLSLLRLCRSGLPLPLGAIDNRRSMIYVGNLAAAIIVCIDHAAAAGQTFLVSDGDDVSVPELIRRASSALGRRARLVPLPPSLLVLAGRLSGQTLAMTRLTGSLTVDDAKIRRRLAWQPPYSMEDGLAETAQWFRSWTDK